MNDPELQPLPMTVAQGIELLREASSKLREAKQVLSTCHIPRARMNLDRIAEAEGKVIVEIQHFLYSSNLEELEPLPCGGR